MNKCPVCKGGENWKDYPLYKICEKHRKRLLKILTGDTSKKMEEK